ncbi:poly(3-hydroxybutyrate) depolymerase [Rhodobium orientis]|nr:polyhydroxyalkanoate depolymerase [Rhodobium orientis]MBB4301940.1 poly(3-hydroxybutyrate) depolymerase [Rhodobium orientis]
MPYYHLYEMHHAAMSPMRAACDLTRLYFNNPLNPLTHTAIGRNMSAACEVFERATRRYGKPEFGLPETVVGGERVKVREQVVWEKPFCRLLHFERQIPTLRHPVPKLLIVAPMSGHYATLLRGTVEAMLPRHDVYITDWVDARMVPLAEGKFDLDDYVDYIIEMLQALGSDTHVVAVCQPSVPVLAAVAVMDEAGDPYAPCSMTLMGGPIDTRVNPTAVNDMAKSKDMDWFERNVIMKVPLPHPGVWRDVYPGFLQLSGFMSMNLDRHLSAQHDFYNHLIEGDGDSAEKHRDFYDEYLAVMDLTAEFYLQTVETVFVTHALPKGELMHHGKRVDTTKIRNVALLTVEGEKDDISGVGQTHAAHRICPNIPAEMRAHYVQPGVGHYGVFNGSRFRAEIAPRISDFIITHSVGHRAVRARRVAAEGPPVANTLPPSEMMPRPEPAEAAAKEAARKAAMKGIARAAAGPKAEEAKAEAAKAAPDSPADDLKKISGVGPKIEKLLNEAGIFHFWQIAELSADQLAELEERLAFAGRATRDDWVGQARALIES